MVAQAVAELPDVLLSKGRTSFTAGDAAEMTGVADVYPGLKRLVANGQVFSPARGFYVPIPPEFRSWHSIPAAQFIDAMMSHLQRSYYVSLLSAAELHGVAHQRPQAFQVMVEKSLPARKNGRTALRFYVNTHLAGVATIRKPTPSGSVVIATPETTALDLAFRPRSAGGLDNVATVIIELSQEGLLDSDALERSASGYSLSAVRRVGWILNRFADLDLADRLQLADAAPTMLDPNGRRRGHLDPKWGVIVNAELQPDL